MVNHFARFGFPPRPWIDSELLKQRFLDISASVHPDKVTDKTAAEQEFKQINEGYNVLRSSRSRLLHLLDLRGHPRQEHVQTVPAEVMEFFPAVAAATQSADTLIKQKSSAVSPMLKVQLMDAGLEQIEQIQALQSRIRAVIATIEDRLSTISVSWPEYPEPPLLKELGTAASALGFLDRWSSQLQERIGALTF
jgi:DnaJ-domain-containing protein 1